MKETRAALLELIALTEMHLFQEYEKGAWLMVEKESYESLKNFAKKTTPSKIGQEKINVPEPLLKTKTPANIQKTVPPAPKAAIPKSEPAKEEAVNQTSSSKEPLKPQASSKSSFDLQLLPSPNVEDFKEMKKLITRLFPHLSILEPPSDSPGEREASHNQVFILFSYEEKSELPLLQNLAHAIRISLRLTVSLIRIDAFLENELSTTTPKLLIAQEKTFLKCQTSKETPKIHIPTLEAIEKNPSLKSDLWKQIVKEYKTLISL